MANDLFKKGDVGRIHHPKQISPEYALSDFGTPYYLLLPPKTKGSAEDNGGVIINSLYEVWTPIEAAGSDHHLEPLGMHANGRVFHPPAGQLVVFRVGFTGSASNWCILQLWARRPNASGAGEFKGALWERALTGSRTVQFDATDDFSRLTVDDGTGKDRSVTVQFDNSSGTKYWLSEPQYVPTYGRFAFTATVQDDEGLTSAEDLIILVAACAG